MILYFEYDSGVYNIYFLYPQSYLEDSLWPQTGYLSGMFVATELIRLDETCARTMNWWM